MKKVLPILFFATFCSVFAYSQNVVDLGEQFIESDIFEVRRQLQEQGFSFYTSDEVSVLGFDPKATVIGYKGNDPTNALTVRAKANGASREGYIQEIYFMLTPLYGNRVVSDLSSKGYEETNSRSFLANNQWTFTERTYKKSTIYHNITAVATFGSKGECMSVVFTKTVLTATERLQEEERRQAETLRQREEAERQRQEVQRREAEAISNRISNAFSSGSSQDTRQGNASATAYGIAASFNLDGRFIGNERLPVPRCGNEDGRVVVNITVAPNGNVMQTEIGRGTTIESITTQECALEAAERAKFNRIQGSNIQSGTITYIFRDTGANPNQSDNVQGLSLDGRSLIGRLPQPAYRGQEQGRIVVNITVNPSGDVIRAEIGRGTTIDNVNARNSALEAAKKAKYNRIQGTNNQSGAITYNYGLR